MPRIYNEKQTEEVYKRFMKGGTLWFIERTDTNCFLFEPITLNTHSHLPPIGKIEWAETISIFILSGAFLTKGDAEIHSNLTEGGCSCCGHGSKPIPIKITEHLFED